MPDKRMLWSVATGVVLLVVVIAGTAHRWLTEDEQRPNAEAIVFDHRYRNLGDIPHGIWQDVSFEFTNSGPEPVAVDNVTTTCSCTALVPSEWPLIAPGGSGVVEFRYKPKAQGGPSPVAVRFTNGNVYKLSIESRAFHDAFASSETVEFGSLRRGVGDDRSLLVVASPLLAEKGEVVITEVSVPWVVAEVAEVAQYDATVDDVYGSGSSGGTSPIANVRVRVTADAPLGKFAEMVSVGVRDEQGLRLLPIVCKGEIVEVVSVSPRTFGAVGDGGGYSGRIVVRSLTEPFQVINVQCPGFEVQSDLPQSPFNEVPLMIRLEGNGHQGDVPSLVIETTHPDYPRLLVPVTIINAGGGGSPSSKL